MLSLCEQRRAFIGIRGLSGKSNLASGVKALPLFLSPALDRASYFCNYGIMERIRVSASELSPGCDYSVSLLEPQWVSIMDSVLTQAVLIELKLQAPAGCVLCSLDALDEGEWD